MVSLVAPEYVQINSIEGHNSINDALDGKTIDIAPGTGISPTTLRAMGADDLNPKHVSPSGLVMTAVLVRSNFTWLLGRRGFRSSGAEHP